jgi:hypothetical protein
MTTRKSLAVAILFVILSVGSGSASATTPGDKPEYTPTQIHKMAKEARTVEQFTVLADYYQTQRRMYQRRAAEEMRLWAERSAQITPLSEKWPRPVDSSRNRYEYFEQMADESAALVDHYSKLADAAPYQ